MSHTRRILELFGVFFRIGLFTFGGGYAMISLIEAEVSQRRGWIEQDELSEVFAVAEMTPGPIAINCATYVGRRRAGFAGALAATLGVITPSFGIIYAISGFMDALDAVPLIQSAFKGIQAAVALLILRAGLRMLGRMPKKPFEITLAAAAGVAVLTIGVLGLNFSTIWLILAGALAGMAAAGPRQGRGNRS